MHLIAFVTACCACGWPAPAAHAQIDTDSATITTTDNGDGALQVDYFCERGGGDAAGYLHVSVSTTKGPTPRQRDLEIVFYAHTLEWPAQTSVAYHLPIQLREGGRTAEASLPFFIGNAMNRSTNMIPMHWDVAVREDGQDIESTRTFSNANAPRLTVKARTPGLLNYHLAKRYNSPRNILRLVDDAVGPASLQGELVRLLLAQDTGDVRAALSSTFLGTTRFGVSEDPTKACSVRTLSSAPEQWQYYLQFKLVVIDHGGFEKLRLERAAVAEAIKQYVAAGGCLLLVGHSQTSSWRLIDEWLLRADKALDPREVGWVGVQTQRFAWWLRDRSEPQRAGLSFGASPDPAPNSAPRPGLTPAAQAPSAQGAAKSFASADHVREHVDLVQRYTRARPTDERGELTLGGIARDGLIALETIAEAEYGDVAEVWQEFVETLLADDGLTAMGGMPGPSYESLDPTGLRQWFSDLREKAEQNVMALEEQQIAGCAFREHVLGRVAFVDPGLDSFSIERLQGLLSQLQYSASIGANAIHDEAWSWRNLIQSVGKPPVWIFCAIVLLFGLVLGPGLLVLTAWARRRSLLIFLVPCISLIATVMIVAYEVLHEGFDTSIRVSSVLAVDERSGDGFAWSRQTYFSGWPPREGLRLPTSVYFRPVAPDGLINEQPVVDPRRGVQSHISVGESELRWNGWLRSRQQQQLLIGHPAKISVPLKVRQVTAKQLLLKNLTDQLLPFAVVRDGSDGYYLAERVDPGAEVECPRLLLGEVAGTLARHRAQNIPTLPDGLLGTRGWARGRGGAVTAETAGSWELLNYSWDRYVSDKVSMPNYGFATIVKDSSSVFIPLEGKVTDSGHLVVGRLVW